MKLKSLGKSGAKFDGLEVFPAPSTVRTVTMTTDEVTALCPVTGQPDWYTVTLDYKPGPWCIESKSFKLYVQSFRNKGHFCERLAEIIARDCAAVLKCQVRVTVVQKPRGGVSITAHAERRG